MEVAQRTYDVDGCAIVGTDVELTVVVALDVGIHPVVILVAAAGDAAPHLISAEQVMGPDPVSIHADARPDPPRRRAVDAALDRDGPVAVVETLLGPAIAGIVGSALPGRGGDGGRPAAVVNRGEDGGRTAGIHLSTTISLPS